MNMTNRTPAPASSARSLLRRLMSVTTAACVLTVAAVSAADGEGHGKFNVSTIAGVGDNYTGKLDVKGDGKFKVKDDGANIVFKSHIGKGSPDLTMKDKRQDHTTGKDNKLGLKPDTTATITVAKSGITFPEAGKKSNGTATGSLSYLGKSQDVKIKYTARSA